MALEPMVIAGCKHYLRPSETVLAALHRHLRGRPVCTNANPRGQRQALPFDTGMGIGDIKKITSELTKLPIAVLNSHTHNDPVGGNGQFDTLYGMDLDFTRTNARGSRDAAQSEVAPSEICGNPPKGFDRQAYVTKPWKITAYKHDGDRLDLGGRTLEIVATPGHTPDSICLLDREHGLLFTGDTYYPDTIWLHDPITDLKA
jgi:glyoxylase-like metal-dependent hydrolase (beta-lactamase superfamily II)